MRVLLIDDNLMSSHRLAGALGRLGHQCAVDAAATEAGDAELVVVNLGSRGLPGVELVARLKSTRPELRVVGFCGHLEVERRRAALAAGIDRLFTNSDTAERPERLLET
ncbi:MAG: response regulator [Armatimonadetes bacterium]|nr:response regulator [Armatimonadota bacterium]